MTEKGCDNCYYTYFDERAYPCSLCIRGIERTDQWQPSQKTKAQTEYDKYREKIRPHDPHKFDEFICLDALKARLLYERFKELTEDMDSLLTDNPRVNVMTYSEAIERKQADTPQTDTHDLRTDTHECVKDTHDKTEPTISEKEQVDEPQTCDTCKFEDCDREKYPCVYCINEDKMWQPKGEPQIVDWGKRKPCTLELFDDDGNYIEPKTEPKRERSE